MQAFMFPQTAAELLAKSRVYTSAKRAERETKQRQVREFEAAFSQLLRLQWDEKGARELANQHVYGRLA